MFRNDIDPINIHLLASAFCFFRVVNQHSFGTLFGAAYVGEATRERHRRMIGDAVLAVVTADGPGGGR